jgi:hypothetical protein
MKNKLLLSLVFILLISFHIKNFAQAPNLGTTATYVLFTTAGAITNTGSTLLTGDVGTNVGAFTGSPTVVGQTQVANAASAQAASDLSTAYSNLNAVTCGIVLGTPFGNSQVLTGGVYCQGTAATLNGNLILDGQCNPNTIFIFKIDGALSTNTSSNIILINSASVNNVFWLVTGALNLGTGSVFRGTAIAGGAISILTGATLKGRGLTTAGQILTDNVIATYFDGGLWNGSSNANFGTAENWSYGSVPSVGENITFVTSPVNDCVLDANRVVGNIVNASNKNLVINGYSFTIIDTIKQTSTGKIDGTTFGSSLIMAGCLPQIIPANATTLNTIPNLKIKNNSGVTIAGSLNIKSKLTIDSGTLYTNNNLILKSNSIETACIDEIKNGGINGNITVERFIPANGRKYRFLASPVLGGTTLQWRDGGGSSSGKGTQITGGSNSSLYDVSASNASSAFLYDESNATEGTDINAVTKWLAIDGNTSLINGKGYRVFVRGDRTISLTTLNTSNNATTIAVTGLYPSSPIALPITYTLGAAQGWNLVGNPFACTIDWDLIKAQVNASDFNHVDDAIYVWNPLNTSFASGGYSSYVAGVGSGTSVVGTKYISSSQSFFIKANASTPIVKIYESHKVSDQKGGEIFKTKIENPNHISIKLYADSIQIDDAVLHFTDGATKNFDSKFDAYDLTEGIGFLTADLKDTLSISGFPLLKNNDVAKINIFKQATGTYKMIFTDLNSFTSIPEAYLIDKYLNKNTLILDNGVYSFDIDSNNLFTYGNTRFEIVFTKTNISFKNDLINNVETNIALYPNPANEVLNINISNNIYNNYYVTIVNISGAEVMKTFMNSSSAQLNIVELNHGVYFVKVTNENGFNKTVKFVK